MYCRQCRRWLIWRYHGLISCRRWILSLQIRMMSPLERELVCENGRTMLGMQICWSIYPESLSLSLSLLPQSGWDIPKIAPLRFLDPDPLLLVNEPGREGNVTNPKFHSLNKAIVQLVSIILYLNWKEEWPRSYEIDWGPPPCLILTPGPHQSRFSWDCYQSHWLYYAIWRRWRTKGGVFFVFFWNGTAATMIVFMYTYTCTDVWLFVQPHDLDEGDFQDLEWCPGR